MSMHVAKDTTQSFIKTFSGHFRFSGMTNCFCMGTKVYSVTLEIDSNSI